MQKLYSLFSPADGLLSIRTVDAPEDHYLIWVDDVLVGRADSSELEESIVLSPIYRLNAPSVVHLQGTLNGSQIEGFVWLQQAAVSSRMRNWIKSCSVAHHRAVFLSSEALPDAQVQGRVIAEIRQVFGNYFDSFGTVVLSQADNPEAPDDRLTVDVQMHMDVRGLQATDAADILKKELARHDPVAYIPLDMATAELTLLMGDMPVLLGGWLSGELPNPRRAVRWQIDETAETVDFEILDQLMDIRIPATQDRNEGLHGLLRHWLGGGEEEALAPVNQEHVLKRSIEIGEPVTILLEPGVTHRRLMRGLKDARYTTLEMSAVGGQRLGFQVEPFSWESLAGRTLVYLGRNQHLDTFLAEQCRKHGRRYRSAFCSVGTPISVVQMRAE